jgi:sugar phosphate isomerase/epimerase
MYTTKSNLRLGTSTYSYWHITPEIVAIESVLESAAQLGLYGVQILHKQMEGDDFVYVQNLKRYAFRLGLDIYNLYADPDFIWKDAETRQQNVQHTLECINLAHDLGIPSLRIQTGGWQKNADLKQSKTQNAAQQPWQGYGNEDALKWAIDAIDACLNEAEEKGVMLLLENTPGLSASVDTVIHIIEQINSPWLRAVLNTGTIVHESDIYRAAEQFAPYVWLVHAQTHHGGRQGAASDLDYARLFRILRNVGFRGYVSIEMAGTESAETAVPKSMELLRSAWERAGRAR